MTRSASFGAGLLLSIAIFPFTVFAKAHAAPAYRITKTIPLGAPDRWDYLSFDAPSHRVYISHGDRLTVVDSSSETIIGNVTGMPGGTHGIGISHATGKGYTDDGRAGVAAAFSLKTLKVIKKIQADKDADAVAFDSRTGHIFVVDSDPGKLTVIDPKTDTVIATIDAGGKLEFSVSGDNGYLYANGNAKREIVRVNTATNAVDAHWPIPDCESPHGLAFDPAAMRLFSSCENGKLDVINANTGMEIVSLPIGKGSDAVRFDPVHKLIFSSNFDGTLSVISEESPNQFVAEEPVKTAIGARTMAIDPQSGRIWLMTADYAENASAPPNNLRQRYKIKPGTAKLLILDRAP
jgi:YVTN family beta-propeller protein